MPSPIAWQTERGKARFIEVFPKTSSQLQAAMCIDQAFGGRSVVQCMLIPYEVTVVMLFQVRSISM